MLRCLIVAFAAIFGAAAAGAELTARDGGFRLDPGDGRVLTSAELVGAVLAVANEAGAEIRVRINAVWPDPGGSAMLLHDFQTETAPGVWQPLCSPDARGQRAGFPVAGAWGADGRFIADPTRLFVTCTSGSQGKCLLFGYDPWRRGPDGKPLAALYEACQHMVRAAYCGGKSYTADGTTIDFYDDLGVQRAETRGDPGFDFEAGWAPQGAVCVSHTRRPEIIGLTALGQTCPGLADVSPCTETVARAGGAILFNRSRLIPQEP